MARPIGIDLGSSGSAAALADGSGVRALLDPLGEAILPSAVHFGAGDVRVGEEARILAPSAPAQTIYDFVPLVGRPFAGATCRRARSEWAAALAPTAGGGVGVKVGDAVHPLTGLAAMVLSVLRNRAGEPRAARITVPATAGPGRRRAIRSAARRAGFTEARLISAPLAAAVQHGVGLRGHERMWVVDLGAAEVEVALVEGDPGLVDLRGARRIAGPSGRDIDRLLTGILCAQCAEASGVDPRRDPAALEVLRREAERARTALGSRDAVDVQIAALMFHGGRAVDLRGRLEAASLAEPLKRLVAAVVEAIDGLRTALDLAREPALERLVLVGGLAASPAVRAGIAGGLGLAPEEPEGAPSPLLAAAFGAARIAVEQSRHIVDGTPLPLRVGRADPAIVIPGGMPLPLTMGCTIGGDGAPVRVWHGTRDDDADHLLGELAAPRSTRVELELDEDGVLEVRSAPLPTGRLPALSTGAPRPVRPPDG